MQYSKICSRAGLVVLVFALIISLVSAVPIPAKESELSSTLSPPSNPSLNGKDHIQLDNARIPEISLSGRMSTLPAATRALTRRQHISTSMDDQLVRRNFFSNIKNAFQNAGNAIKSGFQKAGNAIKHVAQKVGSGIKNVVQKVGSGIKNVAQKVGSGIKNVAQKVGSGIKHAAQKVGSAIKHVAQKVGSGIKNVAQKVGSGIKSAAKKVGNFIKTNGATIAKFGLKVVQTAEEAVGKVAQFIPEVGKPIQQAMHGVSTVAGAISDRINTKLPGNLQKGMDVMNKADEIMGYIPRRRELSEEEAFQQRDIGEAYYFEERDDIALDNREESYFEGNERDIYERYILDWE